MDKHKHISIMNFEQTICENLIEIDYSTFKDTYELNSARMITFLTYRTNANRFVFDLLVNENFVIYKGEKFIIKNAVSKVEGQKVSMDITAYHVMFEFQNHFVEQLDDDSSDKKKKNIHYHSILSMVLKIKRQM